MNPAQVGTKAAAHYRLVVKAWGQIEIRLRLTSMAPTPVVAIAFADFEAVFEARRQEADAFYASITPPAVDDDGGRVLRQALAGMLWTKQFYYYDVARWLEGHQIDPYTSADAGVRNVQWRDMVNADVVSTPDQWEYPWYTAWDLAFHCLPLRTPTRRSPPPNGTSAT